MSCKVVMNMSEEFAVCFKLDRRLRRTLRSSFTDGVEVNGERGEDSILVRHVQAKDPEEARDMALAFANAVLDEYCFRSNFATVILPTPWQAQDSKGKGASVIEGKAVIIDEDLSVIQIEIDTQDCLRFFRKGRWSEESRDWFDAFRNYFFVIEWIAAAHTTRGNEKSRLVATLKRCFQDREALEGLRRRATSCEGFSEQAGDLYTDVAEFLYHANRCQLSHAKVGQAYKVPFDPAHEAEVKAAVPLARYVARELIKWHRTTPTPPESTPLGNSNGPARS